MSFFCSLGLIFCCCHIMILKPIFFNVVLYSYYALIIEKLSDSKKAFYVFDHIWNKYLQFIWSLSFITHNLPTKIKWFWGNIYLHPSQYGCYRHSWQLPTNILSPKQLLYNNTAIIILKDRPMTGVGGSQPITIQVSLPYQTDNWQA